jgi:WD40 repeat protein/serine/threonine protein kinase
MDDFSGRVIKSYTLGERIGMGGFGAVYRAHQQVVEREVAIKIILPVYANHPDFIRSFEVEAQLIARLEHPHIVPLYDYWREPDSAYLVMRWLRGGSLRNALSSGGWSLIAVAKLIDQLSGALSVAHRQGVVHRDIKPDNILLDEDGNAYLTDFGIAADLVGNRNPVKSDVMVGSPEYMAPEQVLREPITPLTDLYSLGIVLYQALTGELPFSDQSVTQLLYRQVNEPLPSLNMLRPDLPFELNNVIWRATSKNPDARYADMIEFATDFHHAALSSSSTLSRTLPEGNLPRETLGKTESGTLILASPQDISIEPANPYKGLRPFEEADARDFFGREEMVSLLLDRLQAQISAEEKARFLAVVGPSGSGKSSVVKAGLIPALRRGVLVGSERWFIGSMVPGPHPINELYSVLLGIAADPSAVSLETLGKDEDGLRQAVEQVLPTDSTQFFLFIDQFEEVFSLTEEETERQHFLNSLTRAVTSLNGRLWVIITLRADFYDRPLTYGDFGALMGRNTEIVLPLSPSHLERAIAGPAEKAGLTLEAGLVTNIVADLNEQPGALPLLQYALTELFEHREGRMLTLKAYQTSGGVLAALARRADDLYSQYDADGQAAVRRLFLRLVTLADGTNATRQRAELADLITLGSNKRRMQQVIDEFSKFRLLTTDRDPATRTPTLQLAHEALIQSWKLLREWIEASRDDLKLQRSLRVATTEWLNARRDPSFLASGSRLLQFETLADKTDIALSEDERIYLQHSIAQRKRAANRLRMFVASLIVFSIVALVSAVFAIDRQNQALVERDRADLQSRISRSRELSLTSLTNLDQLDLAQLLSLEALNSADTFEARNSLLMSLQTAPHLKAFLHGHSDAVRSVAFSPDGTLLASASRDNSILLWDVTTRRTQLPALTGHTGFVNCVTFSPDGKWLASASADNTIRLWDITTGEPVGTPFNAHTDAVWSVAFSPDGKYLASTSADMSVRLWDTASHKVIGQPMNGHQDIVYSVAFNPDGKILATGSADNTVRLWDVATQQPIGEPFEGHTNWVSSVAFSPDGQFLVSTGADQTIFFWDVASGNPQVVLPTDHTNWIRQVSFSPDGQILASASMDGTIQLWDVANAIPLGEPFAAHTDQVWSAVFSPDGNTLASGGRDKNIILWDVQKDSVLETSRMQHGEIVASVAYSPDGKWIASAGGNPLDPASQNMIMIWDSESGETVAKLQAHKAPISSIEFRPEGKLLASTSADLTVILWDMSTLQPLLPPIESHTDAVTDVTFSSDGKIFASSGEDGLIILWNVETQESIGQIINIQVGVLSLAFSPDGKSIASGNRDGTITIWDVATQQPLGSPLVLHSDGVMSVAYSPDGHLLASGSRDNSIILWDVAKRESVRQPLIGHSDWVSSVVFSPDGQTLVSGSHDGSIRLWDVATGQPLGLPLAAHNAEVMTLAFSPDGQRLVSGSRDTTLIMWESGLDRWRQQACYRANRNLTSDEWAKYFPNLPYHETCGST